MKIHGTVLTKDQEGEIWFIFNSGFGSTYLSLLILEGCVIGCDVFDGIVWKLLYCCFDLRGITLSF